MKPDITGALDSFDEMVEALEENEDMVECKECFDLFPKADCERAEVGYICPVCKSLKTAPTQTRFVDPYDCYTQEFPEVTEYNPDSVVDYEKEPDLGDALTDLIKDEYEAIDGYEAADETIQHAEIPEEDKDEILDTLDHIKEEEEEHIDELKELCPECDEEPSDESSEETPEDKPEKLDEAADEEEVEEIPEEDIPEEEAEDSEDSEENENEEVSDLDSAYEAALEIANESGVGQVFGYARKETEEFVAIEPFEVDDPDAVEEDLMAVYDDVAYAYIAFPERTLEETLFEAEDTEDSETLTEAVLVEVSKRKARNEVEAIFSSFLVYSPAWYDKEGNHVEGKTESKQVQTLADALTVCKATSKKYPKDKVYIIPIASEEDYQRLQKMDPAIRDLAKVSSKKSDGGYAAEALVAMTNGKETINRIKKFAKFKKLIDKQNAIIDKATDTTSGVDTSTISVPAKKKEEEAPEEIDETPEETDETFAPTVIPETKSDVETEPESETAETESEITEPATEETPADPRAKERDRLKSILGEKKDPADYTDESFAAYSNLYDKIVTWIDGLRKPEVVDKKKIKGYRAQAESKLVEVSDADLEFETPEAAEETPAPAEPAEDTSSTSETEEPPVEETSKKKKTKTDKIRAKKSISSLSDEDLIALISGITGNRYADPTKAKNAVKRARAFLKGKGFATESFTPDELTEILQENFLREEYHKYANPAELTAMDNLRVEVDKIVEQLVLDLAADGYDDLDYYDSDCYMSGNDSCTITMFLGSEDTFEDGEAEELQDHMTNIVEEALAQIKLPPELIKVQGGALFPDTMLMDEDDEANGIIRGEITVDVYFARKLI